MRYSLYFPANSFASCSPFTLRSTPAQNPYFTNTVLSKTYTIPNLYLNDEPLLEKIEATSINWKFGKSLTYKTVTKKQRAKKGRNAGQIRTVSQQQRTDR